MSNVQTIEDAFQLGGLIIITIFAYFAVGAIWAADTTAGAMNAFADSLTILLFAIYPTTEIGIVLAVVMAVVGGSIPLVGRDPRLIIAALVGGAWWTGISILTNLAFGV